MLHRSTQMLTEVSKAKTQKRHTTAAHIAAEYHNEAKRDSGNSRKPKELRHESHIKSVELLENISGGRGAHTTVSVLDPVISIERTDSKENPELRIVAYFKLQIKIHTFEKGFVFIVSYRTEASIADLRSRYRKKNDKLFDFISLRYLFQDGEKHEVKPRADHIVKLKEINETTKTQSVDVGADGNPLAGEVTLNVGVHVGLDNKLTYEHNSNSWRKGLSFESYAPCLIGESGWGGTAAVGGGHQHHHFQARTKIDHSGCKCSTIPDPAIEKSPCKFYTWEKPPWRYDRRAHWFWQTEASAHLWTPEIYESFCMPITVTRIIPAKLVDDAFKWKISLEEWVWHWLHFDFVVTTRLRELGHGVNEGVKLRNPFSTHASKPAEIRVKDDFGYPIKRDRVTFCVWCCPSKIRWPQYPTMLRQKIADAKEYSSSRSRSRSPRTVIVITNLCGKEDPECSHQHHRHHLGLPSFIGNISGNEDPELSPQRHSQYPEGDRYQKSDPDESGSDRSRGRSRVQNQRGRAHRHLQSIDVQREGTVRIERDGSPLRGRSRGRNSLGSSRPDERYARVPSCIIHRRPFYPYSHTRSRSPVSNRSEEDLKKEQSLDRKIKNKKREKYFQYLQKRVEQLSTSESESSVFSDGKHTRVFLPGGKVLIDNEDGEKEKEPPPMCVIPDNSMLPPAPPAVQQKQQLRESHRHHHQARAQSHCPSLRDSLKATSQSFSVEDEEWCLYCERIGFGKYRAGRRLTDDFSPEVFSPRQTRLVVEILELKLGFWLNDFVTGDVEVMAVRLGGRSSHEKHTKIEHVRDREIFGGLHYPCQGGDAS
ncbi:uncharacterized protein PAC_17247 [Phialocephala subalpina]|uniref:Uncharacterized protein n=1 Tax=Phialocephala subalpina TaxID=576137 RepID=A0A1L7XQW4_9HELO|nr:uncharacterized protein PAC_17247 [Phialocephala subalpina]